jgi:hypothetical protein
LHRCKRAKLAEPIARGGTAHRAFFCRRRLASAAMSTHTQYNITHLVCGGAMCRKAGVGGGGESFFALAVVFYFSAKTQPPTPPSFCPAFSRPLPPPPHYHHARHRLSLHHYPGPPCWPSVRGRAPGRDRGAVRGEKGDTAGWSRLRRPASGECASGHAQPSEREGKGGGGGRELGRLGAGNSRDGGPGRPPPNDCPHAPASRQPRSGRVVLECTFQRG